MDTSKQLANVVDYMLDEVNPDSIINAYVSGYGYVDLLLLSATVYTPPEQPTQEYCLFCEVQNGVPVVDEDEVLHLIILKRVGQTGLISVIDGTEFQTVQELFYQMILEDSHLLAEVPSMPIESGVESTVEASESTKKETDSKPMISKEMEEILNNITGAQLATPLPEIAVGGTYETSKSSEDRVPSMLHDDDVI